MRVELAATCSDGARKSIQIKNLLNINLSNMDIETVDLMPLISESEVRSISFQNNPLKKIDLSPIVMLKELGHLRLDEGTKATTWINLRNVRQLLYSRWREHALDVDSIGSDLDYYDEDDELSREHWAFDERREELAKQEEEEAKRIEVEKSLHRYTVRYCPPSPVESWASLYDFLNYYRPETAIDRMVLNYGLPFALGIDLSGMFIFDSVESIPLDKCLTFNRDISLNQISKAVQEKMLDAAIKQIDSDLTTLGLKIKELVPKYPEFASRFDDVVSFRTSELEEIEIYVGHWRYVDLRGLWLTAYGFDILSALNMDLIITKNDFELVQDAFGKLGLVLKTSDDKNQSYPETIPPSYRELVWWIARHSIKTAWLGNEPRHGWWDYELLQGTPAKAIK